MYNPLHLNTKYLPVKLDWNIYSFFICFGLFFCLFIKSIKIIYMSILKYVWSFDKFLYFLMLLHIKVVILLNYSNNNGEKTYEENANGN